MRGLHEGLAFAAIALGALCAVWGGILAALDRGPGRGLTLAVLGLSLAASAAAVIGLGLQTSGKRPADQGLHYLYGAAAIAFVPIAVVYARDATPRWRSGIMAIAGAAVLIVAWRQFSTGGG